MHWVDRGPEPDGLEAVRSRYTPRWVDHYRGGIGPRPNDDGWREFHDDVGRVFFEMCGYCEEFCRGEVDHFRPKSRFPEKVYQWSNWVFACHSCNMSKLNNWPPAGYVDPCASSRPARPENFFDFDTLTGEIIPNAGLSPARRGKAIRMIDDLRLNDTYHLMKRRDWLWLVGEVLPPIDSDPGPEIADIASRVAARSTGFSSVTRTLLRERGYPVVP